MLGPLDIHQYLLTHDVHHEIVRLPRPATNAEHLAEVLGLPARRCLALHPFHAAMPTGDVLVILLAPSDETPDSPTVLHGLAELLQSHLGPAATLVPARADLISSHTDYLAGHLAPLLLPPDVIVVATKAIVDLATTIVYTATGDGGTALGIRALDLLSLSRALVLPEATAQTAREPINLDAAPESVHLDERPVRPVSAMERQRSFRTPVTRSEETVRDATDADDSEGDITEPREAGTRSSRSRHGSLLRRPPVTRGSVPIRSTPAHTSTA